MLPESCAIAFKEWAVICEALGSGQQTLILRKGGIHEGREGFRIEHSHFWLFPTYLHQADQHKLATPAWPTLQTSIENRPPEDQIPLQLLAQVTAVVPISDEGRLARLNGWHWWSAQTIHERFHYRQPGLFLLVVRIYKSATITKQPNLPYFAGCRSWVELPQTLTTTDLTPVIAEGDFLARQAAILATGSPEGV